MTISLNGRVAVITGAGRGLGRAYALDMARRGASVVVNDIGADLAGGDAGPGPAEQVVAEIAAAGGKAVASFHDVGDAAEAARMIDTAVEAFGGVDILVHNAGNLFHGTLIELPLAAFESLIRVHLMGAVHTCRAACPVMVGQGWGRIVLTTSQVGFFGKAESGAYGAAKMAVLGLMATLAEELEGTGVRVNAIAPFAFTRMGGSAFPPELERFLDPAQVSAAVTYLCSEACALDKAILVAGGGHFAAAATVETRGIDIDWSDDISAETIADRVGEILDMTDATVFASAMAAVGGTFAKIRARATAPDAE